MRGSDSKPAPNKPTNDIAMVIVTNTVKALIPKYSVATCTLRSANVVSDWADVTSFCGFTVNCTWFNWKSVVVTTLNAVLLGIIVTTVTCDDVEPIFDANALLRTTWCSDPTWPLPSSFWHCPTLLYGRIHRLHAPTRHCLCTLRACQQLSKLLHL